MLFCDGSTFVLGADKQSDMLLDVHLNSQLKPLMLQITQLAIVQVRMHPLGCWFHMVSYVQCVILHYTMTPLPAD